MRRRANDRGTRLRKRSIDLPEPPPQRLKLRLVLQTVALVALGAWAVQGLLGSSHGLMRIIKLRRENIALTGEQRQLVAEHDSVAQLARLQRRPGYQEKLAREKLGLAEKDEFVYRVQSMDAGAPAGLAVSAPLTDTATAQVRGSADPDAASHGGSSRKR